MSRTFGSRVVGLPPLIALACSPSTPIEPAPEPPAQVKARLVPWTLEAEGAPPVTLGILDRTENVHCTFIHAADGRLRCLPASWLVTTGIFADRACTEQLYGDTESSWESGTPPRAGRFALPRVACEPERFEARSVQPAGVDLERYLLVEGQCVAEGPPGGPNYLGTVPSLFRAGAILPPERWAAGDETDGRRVSDRLRVRDVVTPDGARFPDHLVDDHWNKRCEIPWTWDACWPMALAGNSEFADETCTQPVFSAPPCDEPAFIGSLGSRDLFALGPRWNGPVFRQGKGCFPLGTPAAESAPFTRGALLGADAVAPAPLRPEGLGRVQAYALRDLEGAPIAPPLYFSFQRWLDTVAGQECQPVRTRAAGVRCVPSSVDVGAVASWETYPLIPERNGLPD